MNYTYLSNQSKYLSLSYRVFFASTLSAMLVLGLKPELFVLAVVATFLSLYHIGRVGIEVSTVCAYLHMMVVTFGEGARTYQWSSFGLVYLYLQLLLLLVCCLRYIPYISLVEQVRYVRTKDERRGRRRRTWRLRKNLPSDFRSMREELIDLFEMEACASLKDAIPADKRIVSPEVRQVFEHLTPLLWFFNDCRTSVPKALLRYITTPPYSLEMIDFINLVGFHFGSETGQAIQLAPAMEYMMRNGAEIYRRARPDGENRWDEDEPKFEAMDFGDSIKKIRKNFDVYKNATDAEIFNKARTVFFGLLTLPIVRTLGLEFSKSGLIEFQKKNLDKYKFSTTHEAVTSIVDLLIDIAETGHLCFATRSMAPIFRRNKHLEEFLEKSLQLRDEIDMRFNDPVWDAHMCHAKLLECISDGRVLLKDYEIRSFVTRELNILEKLASEIRMKHSVSNFRRPPFAVLVYGTPGIGKSYISKSIFSFYHKIVKHFGVYPNLEWDPRRNLYSKNSDDEYFSGYNGAIHWAMLLDDVAQENPKHVLAGQGKSISQIIKICNSIGMASEQAELENKGKIPIIPKCVVASTNTKNLHAHFAVSEPAAIARRFPIVITPRLKEGFKSERGTFKNSGRVEHDAWDYRVEKVVLHVEGESVNHTYEPFENPAIKGDFDHLSASAMFDILRDEIVRHEKANDIQMESMQSSELDELCPGCLVPRAHCKCPKDLVATALLQEKVEYWFADKIVRLMVAWHYNIGYYPSWCIWGLQRWAPNCAYKVFKAIHSSQLPKKFARLSTQILGLTAVVSVAGLAWFVKSNFFTEEKEEEEYTGQSGVWYRPGEKDKIPQKSINDSGEQLTRTLESSMMRIAIAPEGEATRELVAFNLGDGNIVTTAHAISDNGTVFVVRLSYGPRTGGVCPQLTFKLHRSQMNFIGNDLVVLSTGYSIPRKDLREFLPEEPCKDKYAEMRILTRTSEGGMVISKAVKWHGYEEVSYADHYGRRILLEALMFERSIPTSKGDCGSLVIARSGKGWFVHSVIVAASKSSPTETAAVPIGKNMFNVPRISQPLESHNYFKDGNGSSGELQPIHDRSFLNFVEGQGEVLGAFPARVRPVSRVEESVVAEELKKVLPIEHTYGKPKMKAEQCEDGSWKNPWVVNVEKQLKPATGVLESDLNECVEAMVKDLMKLDLSEVRPVDQNTAINGIDGNWFVNSLPMSTSGGFHFKGPKRAQFELVEPDGEAFLRNSYVPNKELQESIDTLEGIYADGKRACVLMQGHLKDEPLPQKKIDMAKTRVFTGCGVDMSIVVRKQFVMLAAAIMRQNLISECAGGMNCYEDWGKLKDFLTNEEELMARIIAGDYASFDKSMASVVIRAAFEVLIRLNISTGNFSERDIEIMRGIQTDLSFPVTTYSNNVLQMYGGNSSGHPLTLIINSIANSLYMRLAFKQIAPDLPLEEFREYVRLMTMGDDNIMSSRLDAFNHTAIAEALGKMGIKYTMADKESKSVPFINLRDADFLKRTFRELDGVTVAPLALESTFKSLISCQARGNITKEQQSAEAYLSARREWSLHGEEKFNELVALVDPIMRGNEAILLNLTSKHAWDWRRTFDWVVGRSDEEEEQEIPVDMSAMDAPPANFDIVQTGEDVVDEATVPVDLWVNDLDFWFDDQQDDEYESDTYLSDAEEPLFRGVSSGHIFTCEYTLPDDLFAADSVSMDFQSFDSYRRRAEDLYHSTPIIVLRSIATGVCVCYGLQVLQIPVLGVIENGLSIKEWSWTPPDLDLVFNLRHFAQRSFIGPIFEEFVKRQTGAFLACVMNGYREPARRQVVLWTGRYALAFATAECFLYVMGGIPVYLRVTQIYTHYVWAQLPLAQGILGHLMFNELTLYFECFVALVLYRVN